MISNWSVNACVSSGVNTVTLPALWGFFQTKPAVSVWAGKIVLLKVKKFELFSMLLVMWKNK